MHHDVLTDHLGAMVSDVGLMTFVGHVAAGRSEVRKSMKASTSQLSSSRSVADVVRGNASDARYRRSMMVTLAWPPPSHIVCNP